MNNLLNIPVKFIHLRFVKYLSSHSVARSSSSKWAGGRKGESVRAAAAAKVMAFLVVVVAI